MFSGIAIFSVPKIFLLIKMARYICSPYVPHFWPISVIFLMTSTGFFSKMIIFLRFATLSYELCIPSVVFWQHGHAACMVIWRGDAKKQRTSKPNLTINNLPPRTQMMDGKQEISLIHQNRNFALPQDRLQHFFCQKMFQKRCLFVFVNQSEFSIQKVKRFSSDRFVRFL